MTRSPIHDRALTLLRKARDDEGFYSEALACDYAAAALEAEGRDPDMAADAVRRAWDEHFRIWGAA
jgi:hypothetical protein